MRCKRRRMVVGAGRLAECPFRFRVDDQVLYRIEDDSRTPDVVSWILCEGCCLMPVGEDPLFPNPVVAEALLNRLVNNRHVLLMDGPSYRPWKRPQRASTNNKEVTAD